MFWDLVEHYGPVASVASAAVTVGLLVYHFIRWTRPRRTPGFAKKGEPGYALQQAMLRGVAGEVDNEADGSITLEGGDLSADAMRTIIGLNSRPVAQPSDHAEINGTLKQILDQPLHPAGVLGVNWQDEQRRMAEDMEFQRQARAEAEAEMTKAKALCTPETPPELPVTAPLPEPSETEKLHALIKEAVAKGLSEIQLPQQPAVVHTSSGSTHGDGDFPNRCHAVAMTPDEIGRYLNAYPSLWDERVLGEGLPAGTDPRLVIAFRHFANNMPEADRAALYKSGGVKAVNAMALKLARNLLGLDRPWWQRLFGVGLPHSGKLLKKMANCG